MLSVNRECKEVLYLLKPAGLPLAEIPIQAIVLGKNEHVFSFTYGEELAAEPDYAEPQSFLYEPDAALLKAGAFKSFATRFGLSKLHPNTHLYTSEHKVDGLPARVFSVEASIRYARKAVQSVLPEPRAQVATRNFPDSADRMRQKLGLRDGGDWYVFGVTDATDRKIVLACRHLLDKH